MSDSTDSSGQSPLNRAKRRLEAGELALGAIVRISRSGEIARIARAADVDFLFLDVQHGSYSVETLADIAQAALGCDITALVRVRSPHDPQVPVVLDGGATGIVFPDVNSAADARAGVDACKFAPIGRRSATSGYPLFDYRPVAQSEAIATMNRNTLVVCMIESVEGVENVEAIAAVDGVDVILIGLTDLLTSLGRPGELGHPEAMAAVERVAAAARANGRFLGVGGDPDLERQQHYLNLGSRFIPTKSDASLLLAGAQAATAGLRGLKW